MLTSSPIISTSANASPTAFRYGPARSPHSSPSRFSAALPRRQPSVGRSSPGPNPAATTAAVAAASITSSPSRMRPRQYVAVDAGTQYSPMEEVKSASPTPALPAEPELPAREISSASGEAPAGGQSAQQQESESRRSREKQPQRESPSPTSHLAQQTIRVQQPAFAGPSGASLAGTVTKLSPTKRRSSDDHPRPSESDADKGESSAAAAKRPRPAEAPPKVLPLKYETCDVEDLVVLIARMLAELIETNDALAIRSGSLTRFHSR